MVKDYLLGMAALAGGQKKPPASKEDWEERLRALKKAETLTPLPADVRRQTSDVRRRRRDALGNQGPGFLQDI